MIDPIAVKDIKYTSGDNLQKQGLVNLLRRESLEFEDQISFKLSYGLGLML